jgi:glycosyltransferase involved in cell wall biosynthesis
VKPGVRLWFDVSYTRTQAGNIGITRTVRRLFAELRAIAAAQGGVCEPVAFHSRGFRKIDLSAGTAPRRQHSRAPTFADRLFGWLSGSFARRLILFAVRLLPWPLLRHVWHLSSELTFNALSREGAKVRFATGDVLIIADASWKYPAWRAARKARQEGAAVVLLVYDLMPIRHPEFCFALVPMLFRSWLHEMIRCSDAVLCISKATENDLRAWVQEPGFPGSRLPPSGHFRLGCDAVADATQGRSRETITAFISNDRKCFGAIGSVEPKKNFALLLQVFEGLWSRGEKMRLLIAGRPTSECAHFVKSLRHHPQQGRLLLTVHDASDAEVATIYSGCIALLLPSLFEGFGLPLVEARTRGCRVIASNIPPFAELADEGVVLFENNSPHALEQAILETVLNPAAAPVMAGFTWADSARQVETLLGELLDQRVTQP